MLTDFWYKTFLNGNQNKTNNSNSLKTSKNFMITSTSLINGFNLHFKFL